MNHGGAHARLIKLIRSPAGIQKKVMCLSGSKAHPSWYADLGRKAKKEIAVEKVFVENALAADASTGSEAIYV